MPEGCTWYVLIIDIEKLEIELTEVVPCNYLSTTPSGVISAIKYGRNKSSTCSDSCFRCTLWNIAVCSSLDVFIFHLYLCLPIASVYSVFPPARFLYTLLCLLVSPEYFICLFSFFFAGWGGIFNSLYGFYELLLILSYIYISRASV